MSKIGPKELQRRALKAAVADRKARRSATLSGPRAKRAKSDKYEPEDAEIDEILADSIMTTKAVVAFLKHRRQSLKTTRAWRERVKSTTA